ncbi:hypothetical protein V5799_028084, partial [Amblyomma americanum]
MCATCVLSLKQLFRDGRSSVGLEVKAENAQCVYSGDESALESLQGSVFCVANRDDSLPGSQPGRHQYRIQFGKQRSHLLSSIPLFSTSARNFCAGYFGASFNVSDLFQFIGSICSRVYRGGTAMYRWQVLRRHNAN